MSSCACAFLRSSRRKCSSDVLVKWVGLLSDRFDRALGPCPPPSAGTLASSCVEDAEYSLGKQI